jgi:hypothetical protein
LTPNQPGNLSERSEFCPAGVHLFGTGNLRSRRESVGLILIQTFVRTKVLGIVGDASPELKEVFRFDFRKARTTSPVAAGRRDTLLLVQ